MFCNKKIETKQKGEEKPIDFAWLIYIGMNKLGFNYTQVGTLYFGVWVDLFEEYKKQYNFETKRGLYAVETTEEKGSLLDL